MKLILSREVIFIILTFASSLFIFSNCKNPSAERSVEKQTSYNLENPQAISFSGEELNSSIPSSELEKKWKAKKDIYDEHPENIDALIWYGRFTAYMGDYLGAIELYTDGINQHPNDPRLYRHRGHRYITIRKIKEAIADFEQAKKLIQGKPNQVEPDGMPNALNIPVSTLHGNIYYHLGLAYYLKGNLESALTSFQSCLETSTSPDNVVSASHWLYMILRELNREEDANKILKEITSEMEIIENHSYYNLCLFYKGVIEEQNLIDLGEGSANDAVMYGIGNWYRYNNQEEKGNQILNELLERDSWNSFGFIAAESKMTKK